MRGIGVLTGMRMSYVDHLTPLCQQMGIPLLVTDPWIKQLIEQYYPPMELIEFDPDNHCLDPVLKDYDYCVYAEPYRKASGAFQFAEYYASRPSRSIYTLHGNSEKCFDIFWFERLVDEDVVMVYGKQMLNFFEQKKIPLKQVVECGNYRASFYEQHRVFLAQKMEPHLFEKQLTTLLYAPTWTCENRMTELRKDYSPVETVYEKVLENIPEDFQVFVKLHPNHVFLQPEQTDAIKKRYQGHAQIRFVDDVPLIYPLLEHVDLYVGDFSSIGYDFLYFNRPLFFLTEGKKTDLSQCGMQIEDDLWKVVRQKQNALKQERERVYKLAFGEKVCTSIF